MRIKSQIFWEAVFLLLMLLVVGAVFQQSSTSLAEQGAASGDAFSNSAMFPKIIAIAIIGLVCIVGITVARDVKKPSDLDFPKPETPQVSVHTVLRVFAFFSLAAFYVAFFKALGFYLVSVATLMALLYLLKTRSIVAYVFFPTISILVVGYVFEILFNVVLPIGPASLTLQPIFR
jgi:hypothetical protein